MIFKNIYISFKIKISLLFKKMTLCGLKMEIYTEICFSTELVKVYAKYSVRRPIN